MPTYTQILAGLTPVFFLIALFSFAFCLLAIKAYKMQSTEFKAYKAAIKVELKKPPVVHKNEIRTVKASISIPTGFKEDPEGIRKLEHEAVIKLAEVLFELDLVKFGLSKHGKRGEAFIVSSIDIVYDKAL